MKREKVKYAYDNLFAPITGAWIETTVILLKPKLVFFAPITGAWIETVTYDSDSTTRLRTHHGCVD